MERALFIAGIALMAFLYGAVTVQYQLFPYQLLKEAKLGLAAWSDGLPCDVLARAGTLPRVPGNSAAQVVPADGGAP